MQSLFTLLVFSTGDRGYTPPYELAPHGEPGIDGLPGLKGIVLRHLHFYFLEKSFDIIIMIDFEQL